MAMINTFSYFCVILITILLEHKNNIRAEKCVCFLTQMALTT